MNNLYDSFERKVLIGRIKLQWLFESLHRFSLRCMNYGQTVSIDESGELFILSYIKEKFGQNEELTLMDVGANTGSYAKALVKTFNKSKIYSFEALPTTFLILSNNLRAYDKVVCMNKALGSKIEEKVFYSDGTGSQLSSFFPIENNKNQFQEVKVSVTTIDRFCHEMEIKQIDFLKIDVEGFELQVLKGASAMISEGRIKNIQFEFGENHISAGVHFYDIVEFLPKYKISRVLKDGLRHYTAFNKIQEIYLSANYLAELKE